MEDQTLKDAVTEGTVNAITFFALSFGLLVIGKQSGQLAANITLEYIILQSTAAGLLRFASYMYTNEEDVTPGEGLMKEILATQKGSFSPKRFLKTHQVGKLI